MYLRTHLTKNAMYNSGDGFPRNKDRIGNLRNNADDHPGRCLRYLSMVRHFLETHVLSI